MTPEKFKAWRLDERMSQADAAEALGISKRSVEDYERGSSEIPHAIALACVAIYQGLDPSTMNLKPVGERVRRSDAKRFHILKYVFNTEGYLDHDGMVKEWANTHEEAAAAALGTSRIATNGKIRNLAAKVWTIAGPTPVIEHFYWMELPD